MDEEHPLDVKLRALPGTAQPDRRLEVIWRQFEEVTAMKLDRPPRAEHRRNVRLWLQSLRSQEPSPTLAAGDYHLRPLVALSLSEKADRLAQHWCTACEVLVRPSGEFPLFIKFPIQAMPWSAQSSPRRIEARQAVTAELRERGHFRPWAEGPICLSIVSLVPRGEAVKDADNLVKGLVDSLQGIVYKDDRQVQCLTSRRVEYAGDVGIYLVSARAVLPWDADVVHDDPTPPTVLSGRRV